MPGKSRYNDTDFQKWIELKFTHKRTFKAIGSRAGTNPANVRYHIERLKKEPEWAERIELAQET